MSLEEFKAAKVEEALVRVDDLYRSGQGNTGGYRVQMREMLAELFDQGVVAGAWEPKATGEPVVAPPSASEIAGAYEARVGSSKSTESHGEPQEVSELRGWWKQTAHDEVAQLVAKMVEYGGLSRATDLIAIGKSLVDAGVRVPEETDEVYTELGIWFYLRGKLARWEAAIKEGRRVSDDTLLDAGVYIRMAQRTRQAGGWPV